ncbi:MAG: hypothetical protein AAGB93_08530 [Planctomycetota bacterium]
MTVLLIAPLLAAALPQDEAPAEDEQSYLVTVPDGHPLENWLDARAGTVRVTPIESDELPAAGYDRSPVNGAYIQSSDGQFRLQIGGYTQIRRNANLRDAPPGPDPEFGDEDTTTG